MRHFRLESILLYLHRISVFTQNLGQTPADTPLPLSRLVLYLCPFHFDNFPLAAALCLLVDKTDELIVDVHLLGFYAVRTNFLFVYHDLLDQLVKDIRCQFLNIGVLPNQRMNCWILL